MRLRDHSSEINGKVSQGGAMLMHSVLRGVTDERNLGYRAAHIESDPLLLRNGHFLVLGAAFIRMSFDVPRVS
jgi:hypothetical protein